MAEQLFNKFSDLSALEKEKQDLIDKIFKPIKSAIEELSKVGIKLDAANSVSQAQKAVAEVEALQKKIADQNTRLIQLEKDYQKALEDRARKTKTLSDDELRAIIQSQQDRRQRIADIKAEGNEYLQLSQRLKQTQDEAKRLQAIAVKTGSTSDQTAATQAVAKAKELYDQVYKIDTKVGDFRRRVGDYNSVWEGFAKTGKNAIDKIDGGFTSMWNNLKMAAASFIGITGIFEFGKSTIETFEKVEMQSVRLENALHNMGGSAKDVEALAKSVDTLASKYTYLAKTDLRESQQRLVQFGKLSAQQITDLMPVIVNFAANARISVQEATDTIIKGVEGNARALKVYGINVKEAGSESERFQLITDELAKKTAGSADIFQNSAAGAAETYRRRLAELKATIGEQLMPTYEGFLKTSIKVIEAIKGFGFGSLIKDIGILIGLWALYKTTLLVVNVAQAFNTAALIANTAASEGVTIAKAAQTLAEVENATVTKANTVLAYLLIGAQKLYALAVRAATFETTIFNTTVKVSPIGTFLTLLGLVVTVFAALSANASEASDSMHETALKMDELNKINRKTNEVYLEQKQTIDGLITKIKAHSTSLEEKKKALHDLIALDPAYLNGLTLANINTKEGTKLINDYITALRMKAFEEAAKDERVELDKRKIKEELDFSDAVTDKIKDFNDAIKRALDAGNKNYANTLTRQRDETTGRMLDEHLQSYKEIGDRELAIDKIIAENMNRYTKGIPKFNKDNTPGLQNTLKEEDKKPETPTTADEFKLDDSTRKKKFEALKIELQDQADINKSIVDNDKETFDKRLKAAQDYYNQRLVILQGSELFELSDADKKKEEAIKVALEQKKGEDYIKKIIEDSDAEKLVIKAKYNSDVQKLTLENEKQITGIMSDEDKRRKADKEKAAKEQIQINLTSFKSQINQFEEDKDKELKAQLDLYAKKKITKEQYEQNIAEIENNYRTKELLAELDYNDQLIKIANIPEDEKTKAREKNDQIRKQLREKENADIKKKIDDQIKYETEKSAKLKELGDKVKEALFTALDAGIENQKNQIQDHIDAIDKEKQKEIDAVNQSVASQQEKANKIAVIEATAQAKKDELTRRQRQLDEQKAKYDKAKAIVDIVENTAIAIIKTLAEYPGPPGIVLSAIIGAIGAAELATVLAQPIPHYAKGTESKPSDGIALVGEAGRELVIEPSGKTSLVEGPTLMSLAKGTVIKPNEVTEKMLAANQAGISYYMNRTKTDEFGEATVSELIAVKNQLKELNKRAGVNLYIQKGLDADWYNQQMKY